MITVKKEEFPPVPQPSTHRMVIEFDDNDLENNPALVTLWNLYPLLLQATEQYYPQAGGPGTDMQGWDLLIQLSQMTMAELGKTLWLEEGVLKNIKHYPSTVKLTT